MEAQMVVRMGKPKQSRKKWRGNEKNERPGMQSQGKDFSARSHRVLLLLRHPLLTKDRLAARTVERQRRSPLPARVAHPAPHRLTRAKRRLLGSLRQLTSQDGKIETMISF